MTFTFLKTATAVALMGLGSIASATELRLSHQWSDNDVRHKVAQIVADEVAAAGVDLEIKIFPTESLFKAREQYTPLSRGQLDMTVVPLSYAGGHQRAYNLSLMPGLVFRPPLMACFINVPTPSRSRTAKGSDSIMLTVL